MFNTDLPTRADLPTAAQLRSSTRNALVAAVAILIAVVLPAEYGIDPTKLGRVLGLTEMGEIKRQLTAEAEADAALAVAAAPADPTLAAPARVAADPGAAATQTAAVPVIDPELIARQVEQAVAAALLEREAAAPAAAPTDATADGPAAAAVAVAAPTPRGVGRTDEMSITLVPGEAAEVKLVMAEGATARFTWRVDGGVANFDLHGDSGGQEISYEQGRGVPGGEGELTAAFDGNHGWFWRNRGDAPVTITLRTEGAYVELKRMI